MNKLAQIEAISLTNPNVSVATIENVVSARGASAIIEKNLSKACQRAVRLAYSKDNTDDANFIIKSVAPKFQKDVIRFFKQAKLVIIENRGEFPRVRGVEDKKHQAKVFETLAGRTIDLTTLKTAEQVAQEAEAKQIKAEANEQKRMAKPIAERVLDTLRKAMSSAQKEKDADVQMALNFIITQYAEGKLAKQIAKGVTTLLDAPM